MFAMENNTIYWMICDTPIKMLIFHSKVCVLIGGLNGSNMPRGLDRLCLTMLPCCIMLHLAGLDFTGRSRGQMDWRENCRWPYLLLESQELLHSKTLCAVQNVQNGLGISWNPPISNSFGGLGTIHLKSTGDASLR